MTSAERGKDVDKQTRDDVGMTVIALSSMQGDISKKFNDIHEESSQRPKALHPRCYSRERRGQWGQLRINGCVIEKTAISRLGGQGSTSLHRIGMYK